MPLPQRVFPSDDTWAKRDDDYQGKVARSPLGMAWQHRRMPSGPFRKQMKRVALGVVVLICLYYLFKNMPTDFEQPRSQPFPAAGSKPPPVFHGSTQNPAAVEPAETSQHYFNGPIKFYQLASTLRAASNTQKSEAVNRNVLFAAASLKSASILLPIACEMAMRERNYVHFALMGRDDISMDILKSVNGLTKECKIVYHDARPDFSVHSSAYRMEVSCSAAFSHINSFLQPQATFIDSSGEEEIFFMKGLKERANSLGRTVIELPENAEQTLMWTTLLDSASLSAWNKVSIDIVVHAPVSSSGSLMRLLDSLKQADFFSSAPPRLTIELTHHVDGPTRRYLEHFKWPPHADQASGNLLAIHHRIPQYGLTTEENSIRFLEAFWPADPFTSHVLILSPHIELSPLFFHYLKYALLEYKYTSIAAVNENLLGISLDLPTTHLNDSTIFSAPLINDTYVSPFLWQAPNSNAALYFGDKWVELHDFVAQLLSSQHKLPTPTTLNERFVSDTFPFWLEHILKLARARGYLMLYPNFEETDRLATIHRELYQPPEQYSRPEEQFTSNELTADLEHHLSLKTKEAVLVTKSLSSILPFDGNLPRVSELPLLEWDGKRSSPKIIEDLAISFSKIFRHEIGGCNISARNKPRVALGASDLFCLFDATVDEEGDIRVGV